MDILKNDSKGKEMRSFAMIVLICTAGLSNDDATPHNDRNWSAVL